MFHRPLTIAASLGAALLIAACAPTDPFAIKELEKGAQVDVRSLLAVHGGKTGCVDYRASDNSCASLIKARVSGNRVVAVETGAVRGLSGEIERVTLTSRGRIENGGTCITPGDLTASDSDGMGDFLREATNLLIEQFGGKVCAFYFEDGEDYVISSLGADGRPFPPGDSSLRFVDGEVSVRAQ
ncbi:hypothetical protein KDD17_08820 [Sulfitobacter albidus]|uniref:Lipoprotein n=1 Tax=Sulfitobacter albidus TaxID=2829501 RepID=A0A975JAZ4_9RHOB|nr:hypothetical protein [Sulfitobacter albidus]QUJ75133.1 hypothetical protein KDD17_08820 [Sulfitobacter albidus]